MASAWIRGSDQKPTRDRTQRFLATFGIHLVSHFCSEEQELEQTRAPNRSSHRREHRLLARELRGLLVDLQHGLDRTSRINLFLAKWRRHEWMSPQKGAAAKDLGH